MGDYSLINPQLVQCGRLSMPEGLKELMSDISREVLRAQPPHLYKFIAEYLSALLVTRENISIACRMCGDVCKNICHRALVDELKDIGFNDTDASTAADIITKYFADGGYKEAKLMMKLLDETEIEHHQFSEIKTAIENTFYRQKMKNILIDDSNECEDDISRAVNHTLRLYEQTSPTLEQSCKMAQKIQTAYRAYGVRRCTPKGPAPSFSKLSESDSYSCDQVAERPFRDSVELFKMRRVNMSDSESNTESIHSASNDIAEVAEIEHATIDYTLDDPVLISKPVVYDKTSAEDLNICHVNDSMDAIQDTSNIVDEEEVDDEASVAEDSDEIAIFDENIIADSEEVIDNEIKRISKNFKNQASNNEVMTKYTIDFNNDMNENDKHEIFSEIDNTEYVLCEHDDCPHKLSEQEYLPTPYYNPDRDYNKDNNEGSSKNKTEEREIRKSKINLSNVSKSIMLDKNLGIIIEDTAEDYLPVTDSTHAYVKEVTHFDTIIKDNKLVAKVIGEARKSITSMINSNKDVAEGENMPHDDEKTHFESEDSDRT